MLVALIIRAVVHPHQPPEQVQRPPAGAFGPHEPVTVLVQRQRMTAGEPPLDVQVDQRKDLGIVQLGRQRRRIGIFTDPRLQLGIAQQAGHTPFLLALVVQHVPLGNSLCKAAQRLFQRVHVIRVIADHHAQRARINQMCLLIGQRVIGVQQQHIRQLALQQRQLARHMDRRHMFLHRPASQGAGQLLTWNVVCSVCSSGQRFDSFSCRFGLVSPVPVPDNKNFLDTYSTPLPFGFGLA